MYMRNVIGYEDRYYILDTGQVFSRKRSKRSKINGDIQLKEDTNSCGYKRVTLSKDGETKRVFVHRLVAEHFLDKPCNVEGRLEVNHIDGDKSNNAADNLEWVSGSDNMVHALEKGLRLRGESHINAKLTDDQVRDVCCYISWGFPKSETLELVPECSRYQYDDIRRRKTWKHISKDYIW